MLQNGHTHFKNSFKFKIYYYMQDHLLQNFENLSYYFGILGIKGFRIFITKFHGICYFVLFQPLFKLTSISIHLHICTAIF